MAHPEDALVQGPEHASRRLVLLHGWGADADDLLELGAELVDPQGVSVVALRAPQPHPGGFGRQWYPLSPAPGWHELPEARSALRRRLQNLAASVPLERTALLGFSQGAAMALDAAVDLPLAALIACSGYPHPDWQPQPRTSVLLTHGREDPVVMATASDELERRLREAGGSVRRVDFTGGHGIDPALFPVLREFLEAGWARSPAETHGEPGVDG
ncbi:MAG: esterase [Synechococcaceae cyanobacterium]|nr:esterase [Synechococcaceae cyanobacterium]